MIFLVAYDRQEQGLLRPVEAFDNNERDEARRRRLQLQLELPAVADRYEVVLLEAASLDVIEQTHARYFKTVSELIESAKGELARSAQSLRERAPRGRRA